MFPPRVRLGLGLGKYKLARQMYPLFRLEATGYVKGGFYIYYAFANRLVQPVMQYFSQKLSRPEPLAVFWGGGGGPSPWPISHIALPSYTQGPRV